MTLTYDEILEELTRRHLLLSVRLGLQKKTSFRIDAYDEEACEESCFLFFKAVKRSSCERLKKIVSSKATLILLEEECLMEEIPKDRTVLLVSSCREAWSYLSAKSFKHPQDDLNIIAITGTNGKTSTAWILSEILNSQGIKAAYIGTLGNSISKEIASPHTTPDPSALFALLDSARKQKINYIALEVSSHSLVQKKVCPLRFAAAVFTSFSRDHLDFHNSMEEYLKTKLTLFTKKYLREDAPSFFSCQVKPFLNEESLETISPIFYGTETVTEISTKIFKTKKEDLSGFKISYTENEKTYEAEAPYLGEKNKENVFVAMLLAKFFLGRWPTLLKNTLRQIPARLERLPIKSKQAPLVFIDYAHTPEALKDSLLELAKYKGDAKLYVLFGCGGDRDPGKRPLMGSLAEKFADHVTVTSDNPRSEDPAEIIRAILLGMKTPSSALVIEDREKAIIETLSLLRKEDCLLLAGKGHENYIEEKGKKRPFSEKEIVLNFYKENKS